MKDWVFAPADEALCEEIARRLDVSPLTAGVLVARGVRSGEDARRFLRPTLDDLIDPRRLPDMEKAVDTICRHARDGSRIVIYGDYDVDGLCSMAILMQFLRLAGLDPDYFVPERGEEGYGVHAEVLRRLRSEGAGLVITVDCGISSVAEAKVAKEIGLDLVITDHHEPGKELPDAAAVVDAKIANSGYPFKDLAGVGVAFKLVWALAERLGGKGSRILNDVTGPGPFSSPHFHKFMLDSMALVAMGTIADVVPLVSENRVFAKYGLDALRYCELPGVQALMSQCRLTDQDLDADSVSFKLGPRLNVAGRMASADLAMRLLMTDSYGDGEKIARELEELNRERQRLQQEILETAKRKIDEEISEDDYVLVLADENWPAGIIGIVASHIVESYFRPTVMISLDGEMGRGSARSIPAMNMVEALAAVGGNLSSFGGHAQAAGLRIERRFVDAFREGLNAWARTRLTAGDLRAKLHVDGELLLDSLSRALVEELARLAPFGHGAPQPIFAGRHVQLAGRPRRVGSSGKHLACYLTQGGTAFRAIGFGFGELADRLPSDRPFHVAFTPGLDTYTGRGDVELRIQDLDLGEEAS